MSKRKMHSVPHSLGEVSVASPARGGRRSAGSGERVGGWAGGREGGRGGGGEHGTRGSTIGDEAIRAEVTERRYGRWPLRVPPQTCVDTRAPASSLASSGPAGSGTC